MNNKQPDIYGRFLKRPLDLLLASLLLLVTLPLLLPCIVLLALTQQGSILFLQQRPGLGGRPFVLVKLKTMRDISPGDETSPADTKRITWLGRVLRALSIDELPQLINVIKGDMSLVGPRPLLMSYLPLYNEFQARRHEVRPGLTGLAQVQGRNLLSWDEKFALDVRYVDELSLFLDLKILFLTAWKVLRVEGINASSSTSMEVFTGDSPKH